MKDTVQINIPFRMLSPHYLDLFIQYQLNPEIGIDAYALDHYSLSDFESVAEIFHAQNRSITLHGPFMDLSPGSPDPEVRRVTRRRFEQVLKLIPLFKPRSVVCHAGYESKRYAWVRELWVENSLELWAWFGRRLKDEGTVLMLENVFEQSPDDIRILFEQLENRNVRFCLDAGHQAAFGGVAFENWLQALGPFLGQLHLHDNSGTADEHLALGKGTIDFDVLFTYLKALPKTDFPLITLEPHTEADLWPSIEYLEKALQP